MYFIYFMLLLIILLLLYIFKLPIPVALRFKTKVRSCFIVGLSGLNPAEGIGVRLFSFCVLCR